ncbi:hypothetical protein M569_08360 [Genlisea aurea]|uniref:Uncharacterized protein n=1 Tax=Genlisea aurea TaxID=192259 RepID=S8CI89_9LAMI|nr:hypothetical protein M569_08360 [Genlisea aurea]
MADPNFEAGERNQKPDEGSKPLVKQPSTTAHGKTESAGTARETADGLDSCRIEERTEFGRMGGFDGGPEDRDYIPLKNFEVELGGVDNHGEEEGSGIFSLSFWLYIENSRL